MDLLSDQFSSITLTDQNFLEELIDLDTRRGITDSDLYRLINNFIDKDEPEDSNVPSENITKMKRRLMFSRRKKTYNSMKKLFDF